MAGFKQFQVVSGWFQLVSGGFRSFLILVSMGFMQVFCLLHVPVCFAIPLKQLEHIFTLKESFSSAFCFQKVFYEVYFLSWFSDKRVQRFWVEFRKSGPDSRRQKYVNCRTNVFRPICFQLIANQINKYISMWSSASFHQWYIKWSNL